MTHRHRSPIGIVVVALALGSAFGCERRQPAPVPQRQNSATPPPSSTSVQPGPRPTEPNSPGADAQKRSPGETTAASITASAKTLTLPGITFAIPDGWIGETVEPGPLAAQAAFRLPAAGSDTSATTVRITHYPNMKGMDAQNIDRWIAQVKKPDGTPYNKTEVTPKVTELGNVRLTTIDLTGTVSGGMGPSAAGLPDHRLIAAIVDHPKGPHFVKAQGPVKSMEQAKSAIEQFLHSAKTN